MELRAIGLARQAGLPTAGCQRPPTASTSGSGGDSGGTDGEGSYVGVCARAPRGEACDWAIYDFVPHCGEEEAHRLILATAGSHTKFIVQHMAKLHALDLTHVNTEPLARFDSWREHLDYLAALAVESEQEDAARAVQGVRDALEAAGVPDLPPALCHFDWHLGNTLCNDEGRLQAVIDWEFAGVGDPRLDLARHCRLERWTDIVCRDRGSDRDTAEIWRSYAAARFGADADAVLCLGPPEPWLAFECAVVLVVGTSACVRAAQLQSGVQGVFLPRCDLGEWAEDMETARWHLRRMGIL